MADVFSFGLCKVVATPAEMFTQHKLTTYVVTYGSNETVESIKTTDEEPGRLVSDAAALNTIAPPEMATTPAAAATAAPAPHAENPVESPYARGPAGVTAH